MTTSEAKKKLITVRAGGRALTLRGRRRAPASLSPAPPSVFLRTLL